MNMSEGGPGNGENAGPDGTRDRSAGKRAPGGMDYLFGTKEGRARLLSIIWLISWGMVILGFVVMVWIFFRGGF